MKILICDDDISVVHTLKQYLEQYLKSHQLGFEIDCFTDSLKAFASTNSYDMSFIDVEMPEISGLKLTEKLKYNNSNIINFIVTSYECYLDDAMDLEVFRYLSKPVQKDRLFRSLDTALKRYRENTQKISLGYYDEFYSVFTKDIIYVTTENTKSKLITISKTYNSNKRLSYWKKQFHSIDYFSQPHSSYIINLRYVSEFDKFSVWLKSGNDIFEIPVSQRGYSSFKKDYFLYMGV